MGELVNVIINQGDLTEQLLRQLTSITGKEPQVVWVPASRATIVPSDGQPLSWNSDMVLQAITNDKDGFAAEADQVGSHTLSSDVQATVPTANLSTILSVVRNASKAKDNPTSSCPP